MRLNILILCAVANQSSLKTVHDNLSYLVDLSSHNIKLLNMFGKTTIYPTLVEENGVFLADYDVFIVHSTACYFIRNLENIDFLWSQKIKDFNGLKVMLKQDEHFGPNRTDNYLSRNYFDLVFTCLPSDATTLVYPKSTAQNIIFKRWLTGYVTPNLRNLKIKKFSNRKTDIGYRGSDQPLEYGRLCRDKAMIGAHLKNRLGEKANALTLDISSAWEDRIHGNNWFDWLGDCKFTLAVESGANVFDLDYVISDLCTSVGFELHEVKSYSDADANEFLNLIEEYENNVDYGQISPRHFEAAALGTVQIMYSGSYSNIFKPGRHFIEIDKHFDPDQLMETLSNDAKCDEIIQNCLTDIINNPEYWIETFVGRFDEDITNVFLNKVMVNCAYKSSSKPHINIANVYPHQHFIDPRTKWWQINSKKSDVILHDIGIDLSINEIDFLFDDKNVVLTGRWVPESQKPWLKKRLYKGFDEKSRSSLQTLAMCVELPTQKIIEHGLAENFSEAVAMQERCKSLEMIFLSILEALHKCKNLGGIIAADFHALIPALVYASHNNLKVVYDAHEYTTEAVFDYNKTEIKIFTDLEKSALKHTAANVTISPQMGLFLQKQFETVSKFLVVPNAPSRLLSDRLPEKTFTESGDVFFGYVGHIAENRHFEQLVEYWYDTDERAILTIVAPDKQLKNEMIELEQACRKGKQRVFFEKPVPPDEASITSKMQEYDVGIIPYGKASCFNYAYCSPNKLGQYMASGLPVLANESYFVGSVLNDHSNGYTANFDDPEDLARAVNKFLDKKAVKKMSLNSKKGFEEKFNWEFLSSRVWPKIIQEFEPKKNTLIMKSSHATFPESAMLSSIYESSPLALVEGQSQNLEKFVNAETCCDLIRYLELRPSSYDWNYPNLIVDFIEIAHQNISKLREKPGFNVLCHEMINEVSNVKNLGVSKSELDEFKSKLNTICSYAQIPSNQSFKLETWLDTVKIAGIVQVGNVSPLSFISWQDVIKVIKHPTMVGKIPKVLARRFYAGNRKKAS